MKHEFLLVLGHFVFIFVAAGEMSALVCPICPLLLACRESVSLRSRLAALIPIAPTDVLEVQSSVFESNMITVFTYLSRLTLASSPGRDRLK